MHVVVYHHHNFECVLVLLNLVAFFIVQGVVNFVLANDRTGYICRVCSCTRSHLCTMLLVSLVLCYPTIFLAVAFKYAADIYMDCSDGFFLHSAEDATTTLAYRSTVFKIGCARTRFRYRFATHLFVSLIYHMTFRE
jgi:hypothetical protein